MTLSQRLILLLLLELTVTSGVATFLCISSEDMTRCTCSIMVIHNLESMMCFQPLELELRDGKVESFEVKAYSPLHYLQFIYQLERLNKLILNNVTISLSFISAVIPLLSLSKLNKVDIISSTLELVQPLQDPKLRGSSVIKALHLEDTTVDPSLLQPSFQSLHHWLFGSLESLGLVRAGLVKIDCDWARRVENLTHLDLSENPISYTSLQNISNCSSLSFKSLKSLHLRHSNLTSLHSLCMPLGPTPALAQLDVSMNTFSIFHFPRCLQGKPLKMLNLSHSGITEVNLLFATSLEELDLSYNSLEVFNSPLQTLKKLYLSNNHLTRLPSLDNLSRLKELKVDSNQLTSLIKEGDVNLSKLEQLDVLHAGRNPYQCDCALLETIIFLDNTDSVPVEDYPDKFLCATPVILQGTLIMNVPLEACAESASGIQPQGSPLCSTLFVGLLSHLIYFC